MEKLVLPHNLTTLNGCVVDLESEIGDLQLIGGAKRSAAVSSVTARRLPEIVIYEHIDHLFISAQDASTAPLSETTMEKLRPTLDSKIWGAFHVVKQSVSQIRANGSITFISVLAGRRSYSGFVLAGAANAGIEAVARNLAVEIAPIRVNTVCAGVIDTEMLDKVFGEQRGEIVKTIAEKLPVKRIGKPEEIADAVLFLMGKGFIRPIRKRT